MGLSSAADLTGVLVAEKYELLRLIGRGGMGAVYEARNTSTLKRCAVKLLLTPELAGDAEVVKRFFREAKASGMIESEHVVAAFDSGIDAAEHVYYVMECLQGEDLEQTLTRLGLLSPAAAIKIILQAATGLASAHALGIVHRDVKPANLFLALMPDGEVKVKILDFGVAKVKMEVFNESTKSLTVNGSLLGTPLYMSPEQLRRASAIDEASDVWSLGVVLFECLTGELPWGNCDGIGELVTAILTLRLPLVQDLAPWVRPELADIAQRALSRDPAERLRSATELREGLLKLVQGDPRLHLREIMEPDDQERRARAPRVSLPDTVMVGPTPHSGTPVSATLTPAPRPRRAASLPMGVAALAVATAATWLLASGHEPPPAARSSDNPVNPPSSAAAATVATIEAAPAPPPDAPQFFLEISPADGAQVTVDGAATALDAGRIELHGPIGSVHAVKVTYGHVTREQPITLTADGPMPSRISLAAPSRSRKPAHAPAHATGATPVPSAATSAPPPPSSASSAPSGLSTVFE
jgi:serine/threonine-protein kinase